MVVATIQIRDIPEDVYENIRRRAAEAGQSLQGYMRQHVIDWGARGSKAEVMAEIRKALAADPGPGVTVDEVLAGLDADRR